MIDLLGGLRDWSNRRRTLRELRTQQRLEEATLEYDENNLLRQATVAVALGSEEEAARKWEQVRAISPGYVRKSHDSLTVLLGLNRFDEAERLMLECQKLFPRDPHYLAGYAKVAHHRGDLAEANRRWTTFRRRFPRDGIGLVESIACLRQAGHFQEAEALITRSVKLSPDSVFGRIEWARVAEAREDWEEALHRWNWIDENLHHVSGVIGAVQALIAMHRCQDARSRLHASQAEHGRDPGFQFVLNKVNRKET